MCGDYIFLASGIQLLIARSTPWNGVKLSRHNAGLRFLEALDCLVVGRVGGVESD